MCSIVDSPHRASTTDRHFPNVQFDYKDTPFSRKMQVKTGRLEADFEEMTYQTKNIYIYLYEKKKRSPFIRKVAHTAHFPSDIKLP